MGMRELAMIGCIYQDPGAKIARQYITNDVTPLLYNTCLYLADFIPGIEHRTYLLVLLRVSGF